MSGRKSKQKAICKRKIKSETETDAHIYAFKRLEIYGLFLEPYKCRYCPNYHLTNRLKRIGK